MRYTEVLSPPESVSMSDDYYNYAERGHFWIRWRFGALKRYRVLLPPPGACVLEAGCGNGIVMQQMEQEFGYTADGCDLNRFALDMAGDGRGHLFQYNILDRHTKLVNRYEAVFLMDVIEHLDDDLGFLIAAAAHVKPGGVVVINVPASKWLYSRYDEICGHKRRYSKKEIRLLLAKAGLQVLLVENWGGLLFPLLLLRKFYLLFASAESVIRRGFSPPGKISSMLLHTFGQIELALPFPPLFGSSVLAIARVRNTGE